MNTQNQVTTNQSPFNLGDSFTQVIMLPTKSGYEPHSVREITGDIINIENVDESSWKVDVHCKVNKPHQKDEIIFTGVWAFSHDDEFLYLKAGDEFEKFLRKNN